MPASQISIQQVRILDHLMSRTGWATIRDIGDATGIPLRAVRRHVGEFVKDRVVEKLEMFGGYRYRFAPVELLVDREYLRRLDEAKGAFGL